MNIFEVKPFDQSPSEKFCNNLQTENFLWFQNSHVKCNLDSFYPYHTF